MAGLGHIEGCPCQSSLAYSVFQLFTATWDGDQFVNLANVCNVVHLQVPPYLQLLIL